MNATENSLTPAENPGLPVPGSGGDWGWLRFLLAGNPAYLASAVLLLFGLSQVSADKTLFTTEGGQTAFNFSAIQTYETASIVAAVATATATRRSPRGRATILVLGPAGCSAAIEGCRAILPAISRAPAGFLSVTASFILLLVGTVAALNKHRWFYPGNKAR